MLNSISKNIKFQNKKKQISLNILITITIINLFQIISNQKKSENLKKINWLSLNFSALDLNISSKGDLFTIGIDKNLYFYEFKENKFIKIEKSSNFFDLRDTNFIKISTNELGNPFIITENYELFTINDLGEWEKLPGCAREISIGRNNNIWKVGCNEDINGYGIWSLNCEGNNNMNNDNEITELNDRGFPSLIYLNILQEENFKKIYRNIHSYNYVRNYDLKVNNNIDNSERNFNGRRFEKCFWIRSEVSGIKIKPNDSTDLFLIDKEGILKFHKTNKLQTFIFEGIKARDLTLSNDGIIFLTDSNDFSIYRLMFKSSREDKGFNDPKNNNIRENPGTIKDFYEYLKNFKGKGNFFVEKNVYEFIKLNGKALFISSGPYSQPFIIDREGILQSSAKLGFN